jgi:hypothetical protein
MRLLFENDELDKLIQKYHLLVYSGIGNDYYICFDGDVPSSYIGIYSRYSGKAYLFDSIHLKHDKIIGDKNKKHYYIEVEPFEKHLNELIIQRKKIIAEMKERKMKKDFK